MTELSFPVPIELAERIESIAIRQGVAVAALLCDMSERMVEEFEAFEKFRRSAHVHLNAEETTA